MPPACEQLHMGLPLYVEAKHTVAGVLKAYSGNPMAAVVHQQEHR